MIALFVLYYVIWSFSLQFRMPILLGFCMECDNLITNLHRLYAHGIEWCKCYCVNSHCLKFTFFYHAWEFIIFVGGKPFCTWQWWTISSVFDNGGKPLPSSMAFDFRCTEAGRYAQKFPADPRKSSVSCLTNGAPVSSWRQKLYRFI